MDRWWDDFLTYQFCKCCLMEAMLKDDELQIKYSERNCDDYCRSCCRKQKETVTGCNLDDKRMCCLIWCPCCHTCGTLRAERKAGSLVGNSDDRCCLDTVCPCLCCDGCIYAWSTKGPKNPDEMDAIVFTSIAPPGVFEL